MTSVRRQLQNLGLIAKPKSRPGTKRASTSLNADFVAQIKGFTASLLAKGEENAELLSWLGTEMLEQAKAVEQAAEKGHPKVLSIVDAPSSEGEGGEGDPSPAVVATDRALLPPASLEVRRGGDTDRQEESERAGWERDWIGVWPRVLGSCALVWRVSGPGSGAFAALARPPRLLRGGRLGR